MSLVKIEDVAVSVDGSEENGQIVHCCDKHVLINSRITLNNGDNISYVNYQDLNSLLELQQLRCALREKDYYITSIERENHFLKEQVKALNIVLDQLSVSTRNLATKNDIRIKVENSSSLTFKKWYRRPKVVLTGSAVAVLFSVYLRYKIKNWQ